ncbi:hypothetical protein C0993_011822 [Termitomyces sp. T159_Od127]|nr:hypothetical protein C0993_011822 [Termitomyces sp. T159_Od127]
MPPVAAFMEQSAVVTPASVALTAPKAPKVQRTMYEEIVVVEVGSAVPPLKGTMGQPRHGPPAVSQAPEALGPSKTHWGQKLPLAVSQLANISIWGLLDVERLNLCFQEAIGPGCYYSYQMNTVFISAEANWEAAFEFSSGQQAKIPGMMVYKFACHGFFNMLFELEQLHKYYMSPHILHCNCVVTYMLLTKLQEFV